MEIKLNKIEETMETSKKRIMEMSDVSTNQSRGSYNVDAIAQISDCSKHGLN